MNMATPALRELAQRVLEQEARESRESCPPEERWAAVAGSTFEKLRVHMSRLVGPDGFTALFNRAVTLAKAEHPSLEAFPKAGGALPGMRAFCQEREPSQAAAAVAATLAQFLGLLANFIGDDVVLHLVCQVWPKLSPDLRGPGSKEVSP